jgi:hypothetical protein
VAPQSAIIANPVASLATFSIHLASMAVREKLAWDATATLLKLEVYAVFSNQVALLSIVPRNKGSAMTGFMKSIQLLLKSTSLLLALLLFIVGATAQGLFSSAIDDLPLMEGLNEVAGGTMVFDSPSGRIVEALSTGDVTRQRVTRFYSETLPQLGWLETTPRHFVREGEALKIEFPTLSAGATINVLFMLSPAQ